MVARWLWNCPAITSENFDDEVVIVNFDSGKYHSLQGSGPLIWQWLQTASTIDDLLDCATSSFSGDAADIENAVRAFVATLQHERLIIQAPAETVSTTAAAGTRALSPFTRPILSTFSDMEELLLLDPIHEVDEAGWPVAKDTVGD